MNKNSQRSAILILITALFTISAVVLRTVAALRDLEDNLIYYGKSGLTTAASILLVGGSILLISLSFTFKKEDLRAKFTGAPAYIPTGIVAAVLLLFAASTFGEYLTLKQASALIPSASITAPMLLGVTLLAVLSAVHFILNVFIPERHARIRACFSIATLLLMALYTAFLYFNTSEPINSTNKLIEEMAYLFAALFLLYETRISLGREMWRAYMAFGAVASLLTASASIPSIIHFIVRGTPITNTIESAVLLLSLFIFIFLKLCLVAVYPRDEECKEMAALRELAEKRQSALDNKSIEDGTQISIDELIDIPFAANTDEPSIELEQPTDEDVPEENEAVNEATNIEWTEDT